MPCSGGVSAGYVPVCPKLPTNHGLSQADPPQPRTKSPSSSSSTTGGAAIFPAMMSAAGTASGRWKIQTWSRESAWGHAAPPQAQLFGSGLG